MLLPLIKRILLHTSTTRSEVKIKLSEGEGMEPRYLGYQSIMQQRFRRREDGWDSDAV